MRSRCRPKGWAESIGFRWPTPGDASVLRASSPRPDQGGSVKPLMQADFVSGAWCNVVAPQSDFDRRRFAPSVALANPTTPASADADLRPLVAPASVPSPPIGGSADAGGSHVPLAPTRAPSRRWWSAYTDDGGRSEFPLEPPSFATQWWAARRPFIVSKDSSVALPLIRVSQTLSRAGRYV